MPRVRSVPPRTHRIDRARRTLTGEVETISTSVDLLGECYANGSKKQKALIEVLFGKAQALAAEHVHLYGPIVKPYRNRIRYHELFEISLGEWEGLLQDEVDNGLAD